MFGFSRNHSKKEKTYNYNLDTVEVKLEFNTKQFWLQKEINYKYKTACKPCNGTGAKDAKIENCRTCGGVGQVHSRQGFMTFAQTCPTCSGSGQSKANSCKSCSGTGFEEIKGNFTVDIQKV